MTLYAQDPTVQAARERVEAAFSATFVAGVDFTTEHHDEEDAALDAYAAAVASCVAASRGAGAPPIAFGVVDRKRNFLMADRDTGIPAVAIINPEISSSPREAQESLQPFMADSVALYGSQVDLVILPLYAHPAPAVGTPPDRDIAYLLDMARRCEAIENTSGDAVYYRRIAARLSATPASSVAGRPTREQRILAIVQHERTEMYRSKLGHDKLVLVNGITGRDACESTFDLCFDVLLDEEDGKGSPGRLALFSGEQGA